MAIQGGTVRWVVEANTAPFEASMRQVESRIASTEKALSNNPFRGVEKGAEETAKKTEATFSSLMANLSQKFNNASSFLAPLDSALSGLTTKITGATSLIAGLGAKQGLGLVEELENSQTGLTFLLKDQQKAANLMKKIRVEAQRTPFDVGNLSKYTQQLTAVTKDGNKALDTVLAFGQGIIASGQDLSALGLVAANLQQIGATGKLTQMDLMQFKRAVPIFDDVLKNVGLTSDSLKNMKDPLSAITMAFQKFGEQNDIYGETANNIQQLKASFEEAFAGTFGDALRTSGAIDLIKNAIKGATQALEQNKPLIDSLFKSAVNLLKDFDINAAIGGIVTFLKTLLDVGTVVGGVLRNVVLIIGGGDLNNGIRTITTALLAITGAVKVARIGSSVFGTLTGVLGKFGAASKVASKGATIAGKGIGSFITSVAQPLGAALPALLKASLAIAVVGAAIGVAIGAVGGGIWLFGQGLSALGKSFGDLADGAQKLSKADISNFPKKLIQLGQGLAGIGPRFLDFATAAATFPEIGRGFYNLAQGLKELSSVGTTQFKKLPELANALKDFQIDFVANVFGGNVLTKFKDLGDSIKNVADLMNLISEIKIPTEKLTKTMSSLADGLKTFLFTEFQPNFLEEIFGKKWKVSSVTDYLGSLKNIISPIESFAKLQKGGIDSGKLKTILQDTAEALKSFLITEVQPSYIEQIFGKARSFKVSSVTDYVKNLSETIKALSDVQIVLENAQKAKIDSGKITGFLSDLGNALQSFVVFNIDDSIDIFYGAMKKSQKTNLSSVLNYVDKLKTTIDNVALIQSVLQNKEKTFDANQGFKINIFLATLAQALRGFIFTTVDESIDAFYGGFKKSIKVNTSSVLTYVDNLKTTIDNIDRIQQLFKDKEGNLNIAETGKINKFLSNLAMALRSFTIVDINESSSEFFEMTKKSTTINRSSVLQYANNLSSILDSVAKIFPIIDEGDKKLAVSKSTQITSFIKKLGNALKAFTVQDIDYETAEFLGRSTKLKTNTKSILDGMKNFDKFVSGVVGISNLFTGDKNKQPNVPAITGLIESIGKTLKSLNIKDIEVESKDLFETGGKYKEKYSNVLANIGDFNSFAQGVKTLTELASKEKFNAAGVQSIMESMRDFLKQFNVANIEFSTSGPENTGASYKITYTNILGQIGDFQKFAEGVKILVDLTGVQNFNADYLWAITDSISQLISGLGVFTTETTQKYSNGETTWKESYTNALAHIGDFQSFSAGVKTLAEITAIQNFNIKTFQDVTESVMWLIRGLVYSETEHSEEVSMMGKTLTKEKIGSALTHLGDFQNFAQGVKTIAELTTMKDFNVETFKKTITAVFEAIKHLSLKESETVNNGGWFGGGGSEKISYSSALQQLGDFKGFVAGLSQLMSLNLGNGENLKNLMGNIAEGVKKFLTINEVDMTSVDTEKLKSLFTSIGTLKQNTDNWDTSQLAQKGTDIGNFIKNLVSLLNADFEASVNKLSELGTKMVENIKNGITSNFPTIQQAANDLQGSFWNALEAKMMDEFYQGAALIGKVREGIVSVFPQIQQAGRDTQGNFWNALEPKLNDEYWQGRGLIGKLIDGVNSRVGELSTSGRNAAQGFVDGTGWVNVYNAGYSMAGRFIRGLKDRGDEHSPWKTTFKSGIFAGQGLINGITSMEDSLYGTAWGIADNIVDIFESMNDIYRPQIIPDISNVDYNDGYHLVGGSNAPRVIIEQTNNNYTQFSIDQMNRDLEWQLRKV